MAITHIRHDAFARGSYRRVSYHNKTRLFTPWVIKCDWCGSAPKRLFSYTWVADDRGWHGHEDTKHFCNFGCFVSYNS